MLVYSFKSGLKQISRHKGFSFINIAGLALGLTSCLLIGLFVRDEKEYDKFAPGAQNIYRIYQKAENDVNNIVATAPPTFATTLKQNFPEVEQTLRVMNINSKRLVEANGKKLYEEGGFIADSNFFDLFPLRFMFGSPEKVLNNPNSIVISAALAEKFFDKQDPVGQTILINKTAFEIKGVLEHNKKFHLPLNFLYPLGAVGFPDNMMQSWQWFPFNTYVKLHEGTNVPATQSKFQKYSKPFLKSDGGSNVPYFQPLDKIHLYSSDFKYDMSVRGNISYVNALTIIGFFILLIACFNFINLTISKSLQRAKEVGVKKTIGAGRKQLIVQFLYESVLFVGISMALAIVATLLLLPSLNAFVGKAITLDIFTTPLDAVYIVVFTLIVGLLAGFYPALVLSGFQPVKVLKGSILSDALPGKIPWMRNGLVVIQFSLSILLIISAIVVIRQVSYMHSKDLGFRKEQILLLPIRGENLQKNYSGFKKELLQYPGVGSVSIGYGFPGDMFGDGMMTVKENPTMAPSKATQLLVDEDYITTLGLTLLTGRDFSKDIQSDVSAYIVNETAVKELGLGTPQEAVGKTLSWPTWRKPDSLKTGQVIGVVKDFHYKSLHERIESAVLHIYPQAYSRVAIKLKGDNIKTQIADIKNLWDKFSPDFPIEYNFLDESYQKMYTTEDKLKSLLSFFTAITIFVACLGLLGLAAYSADRRKKEIGIRKVLGASVQGLVVLLSKDFIKLVFISILIASPVAWYFMYKWLDSFAYRIDITWWMFAMAAMIAIMLALFTVSFQAIKSAIANPTHNLRTE